MSTFSPFLGTGRLLIALITLAPTVCLGQNAPSSVCCQTTDSEVREAQPQAVKPEASQHQLDGETQGRKPPQDQPSEPSDLAEKAKAMARLEGQMGKDVAKFSKRPRKKFLTSRVEDPALVRYLENWAQKTMWISTLNYPEQARGKLYGTVVVVVELNYRDGSLRSTEIVRSSGHRILDDAALRFIQKAAPYGPVPRADGDDNEVLCFVRPFRFEPGDKP